MSTYHTPTHMPARDSHSRQEVLLIYAVSYAITYEPPIGGCTAYLHRRATAVAAPCAKKGKLTNLREQQASLRQKISVLHMLTRPSETRETRKANKMIRNVDAAMTDALSISRICRDTPIHRKPDLCSAFVVEGENLPSAIYSFYCKRAYFCG